MTVEKNYYCDFCGAHHNKLENPLIGIDVWNNLSLKQYTEANHHICLNCLSILRSFSSLDITSQIKNEEQSKT